jgi:hypothetical protein
MNESWCETRILSTLLDALSGVTMNNLIATLFRTFKNFGRTGEVQAKKYKAKNHALARVFMSCRATQQDRSQCRYIGYCQNAL